MDIECPKPTALTAIPDNDCGMKFDQIVRLALQRRQSTPSFDGTDLITVEATWDALKALTTAEKVVMSPIFAGMVIPPSEGAEEGGNDNSTVNGIPQYLGENPVKVTGEFRNLKSTVKAALDKLAGESLASAGVPQIWVYMFNRGRKVISKGNEGIPIYNFRVSTPGSEGYNQDNKHNFSFWLPADWDKDVVMAELDFDPLTSI
jgi:hypothetical protein